MNVDEQITNGEDIASDILEHWGVQGMKWGVRRFGSTNRKLNRITKSRDKASSKAHAENRNRDIDSARKRVKGGESNRTFKAAKAALNENRIKLGGIEAKRILNTARQKRDNDREIAKRTKTGKEATVKLLLGIGVQILNPIPQKPSTRLRKVRKFQIGLDE